MFDILFSESMSTSHPLRPVLNVSLLAIILFTSNHDTITDNELIIFDWQSQSNTYRTTKELLTVYFNTNKTFIKMYIQH